ncbi:molybdenum cofactor biosynthesis protein A [Hoeflea sp. BAL378]|uniref:GTP 3',8-cyclase MoaA n=1 Tax=Hoeflea sp. BAL378 TaxID=1547437 RepID=UPI00051309D6|nr:GTP 3',8-cyclase MoaA [Hoeflea sp. BAL378]KGF68415.1 molybdenum cofactor biosynthesis protein A [Hoeflea sp. BAL378]
MADIHSLLPAAGASLTDGFGRQITYLRLSVTDRCDLRCTYCMSERMTFLPRREVLTLEELYRLSAVFMRHGVRKIRITGGEPLVRKNIMSLFDMLSDHLRNGELDEVVVTTNGSQLSHHAKPLYEAGVRRVNVSLDSLDPVRFRAITRWGDLAKVLDGIDSALAAGLKVKLNAVAMKGAFEEELDGLIRFAHGRGMDLTLIEEMPLGNVCHDRKESHLRLDTLKQDLEKRYTLTPLADRSGGPARYVRIEETGGKLGFITPLSCDFCASCNRIRVACTGELYTCMGKEGSVDLREALRRDSSDEQVSSLIFGAIARKPRGHTFTIGAQDVQGIGRHMSVLGG